MVSEGHKYVKIHKSTWYPNSYDLMISGNGYQWTVIFTGKLSDAKKISETYKKIGSKNYTNIEINKRAMQYTI